MESMDTIGARVKSERIKIGYTMRQLYEITGISTGNISCIENNRYAPSVSALIPLKKALGCSIDWILCGEDTPKFESDSQSESDCSDDEVLLSAQESDMFAMFRILNEHDRDNVFDFITMLYEKTIGKKVSVASTYTADEMRRPNDPDTNDEGQSGIA